MSSLTRIIPLAHELLAEVLGPGDAAVDLTAGNGHDTLFLSERVGADGVVVAFDLQAEALAATTARLEQAGVAASAAENPAEKWAPGVHLVHAGHQQLEAFVRQPVTAVIANLGYLPGSDRTVITRPETTLLALEQAATLLRVGGRMAVVVYRGHDGGVEEAAAVQRWFRSLTPDDWSALEIYSGNRPASPFLLVAEKT